MMFLSEGCNAGTGKANCMGAMGGSPLSIWPAPLLIAIYGEFLLIMEGLQSSIDLIVEGCPGMPNGWGNGGVPNSFFFAQPLIVTFGNFYLFKGDAAPPPDSLGRW